MLLALHKSKTQNEKKKGKQEMIITKQNSNRSSYISDLAQTDVVDGDKLPTFKPNDYTDVDQARVFAEYSKEYIKFSAATDYMVYDGVCWKESVTKVQSMLHDFTHEQLADAKNNLKEAKIKLVNTGADVLMKNIRSMTVEQRQAYDNYVDAKSIWILRLIAVTLHT